MNKTIIILKIEEKIDKNNRKFLILYTNPNKIYVFPGLVDPESWSELAEGKEYEIESEKSKGKNKQLISFRKVTRLNIDNPQLKNWTIKIS